MLKAEDLSDFQWGDKGWSFANKLERELAQLERERNSLEDQRDFARNMIRVLERERDEAREKLERQADRIRYLEGATNHATGTPLTVALRERDEAREQRTKAVEKYQASIKEMHEVGMQRDGLAEALRKIANEDYRGNAPQSVFIARAALATINKAEL